MIRPTKAYWRYGEVDFGKYKFIQLEIFNYRKGIRYENMWHNDCHEFEEEIKDKLSRLFWRHIGAI